VRTTLFDYKLPPECIARRPHERRDGGRLCVVERHGVQHRLVRDLVDLVDERDLIVVNETKVRKARLLCSRPKNSEGGGGARVELLFLHREEGNFWQALGKANRPLRVGDCLVAWDLTISIEARLPNGTLRVDVDGDLEAALEAQGTMPIPPYMDRAGDERDVERYQTVFASRLGSAAAPTAGLHLTDEMLDVIREKGTRLARLTLHVGLGTFRPVSVDDFDDHPMHSEEIEVGEEVVEHIHETRMRSGRVIAIGTTAVRALESAQDPAHRGRVIAQKRWTDLLIQPGYDFRVVDAIWTNFHQPRSTLLALVSAFAGLQRIQDAYQSALKSGYRFLSYGDAMWIPQTFKEDCAGSTDQNG
jgi:S-adenosylmethionine:tRNA ribosyltransferase-isomerase